MSNIQAPTYKDTKPGHIHLMGEYGKTVCGVVPRDTWEQTESDATCKVCTGNGGGWRDMRPRRRPGRSNA